MNAITTFFSQHPYWATAILTWVSNYGVSAFVSSLPAPTATSSAFYVFCFKFTTAILAQNPTRASNSTVESSPNFIPAVNIQNAKTGEAKVVVEAPPAKGPTP